MAIQQVITLLFAVRLKHTPLMNENANAIAALILRRTALLSFGNVFRLDFLTNGRKDLTVRRAMFVL